ncbi:phenylacetate--CoA ligase family protein [Rhodohalobacter sulfatireducens]|uniref:Phenylacetate--CoA ligase family protein n=1 Tax=Rhodohalobacter sulfatireducens TaxID=2911366 RepID=A0ABS9K884_9BACT|nr:hypothetical protein [Rhodohalobacter sulfatireducens]MCG2587070.1 hypothetical protein [Rhodohalobacter sulfatireducens]
MKFKISDYLYPIEIAQLFRFLKRSKAFTYQQLVEHQNEKLRSIIRHAYQHVPYYRELFDEHGIKPSDIQTVEDLPAIPVLTKKIIRDRYNDLIAENAGQFKPYQNQTSGSTSVPTKFLQGKNISIARFAFFWRIWNMAGYRPYMRWAQVDGMHMGSKENLWNHNRMLNSLQISAYNLDHQNCGRILDKLLEFKPKILRGYPTALYTLARHIDHNSYKISLPLKSIITYSENLPPEYRSKITHVFSCPVFDLFSQWEGVCLISECEQNQLHHHMEYSAMELLDENSQPVGDKVEGEITATSFYNYSMPFIRYKTGDLATWGNSSCECGMDHKVVENISGRMVYVLFDTEGNLVPFQRFQIYSFVSEEYAEGLFQAQIVQDSLDKVQVYLVVKNRSNSERIEKEFAKSIKSRLGDKMNIEFVYTDRIPKKKSGKIPFVRNNLID